MLKKQKNSDMIYHFLHRGQLFADEQARIVTVMNGFLTQDLLEGAKIFKSGWTKTNFFY